ncbi:MAG: winged helix-turn-helix domain-containing protein [Terriglobales bacterium]
MPGDARRIFRFGVFEADPSTGELRKAGVRLRLQDQPFQVLLVLLGRGGNVVTRDELRQQLWPADTFVDFDHSLNTIINKLREVLGDSAASPRFIETLAKRGYRFLPAVEAIASQAADAPAPPPPVVTRQSPRFELTRPEDLPAVPHRSVRVLFALIQIMYLCFYVAALARLGAVEELLELRSGHPAWITAALAVTGAVGIPLRLYLLSSAAFNVKSLGRKFLRLFPGIFFLDQLWALAPFLLTPQIGFGLALAAAAALIYLPFSQRTLILMRDRPLK